MGANWPDFWTGWKLLRSACSAILPAVRTDRTFERDENFSSKNILTSLTVRTDRTFERDENIVIRKRQGYWYWRCELTGLLNGMKTIYICSAFWVFWVRTDRTFERDENGSYFIRLKDYRKGANWPDWLCDKMHVQVMC